MKATKLLGSVALTAALAMGAVPAFASQTALSDWQPGTDQGIGGAGVSNTNKMMNVSTDANNVKTGTGSTAVKASVFDADMQVTVPLQLSVAFASVGSTLTCPSDGTYQIINNGSKPVKITNIAATPSGFDLVPLTTATTDLATPSYETAAATRGHKGIAMVLDFGGNNKVDLALAQASNDANGPGALAGMSGGVQEVTISANSPVGINVSGATTKFDQNPLSVGYQLATVMTIQYTVQATS